MPRIPRPSVASLGLALASCALTLLAIEGTMRLLHVPVGTVQINRRTVRRSANPRLRFELRPGSVAHAEVEYRINAYGMRGPERGPAKPPGARRIAVIGDSIAFGYWVAEDDAYPGQLERLIGGGDCCSQAPPRIEVLNFGVPGYDLAQSTEMLRERVLSFEPELVIVALCLNDLEGPDSYEYGLVVERAQRVGTVRGRLSELLLDHSQLFAWIEYRRLERAARRDFVQARDPWAGPLYAETLEQQQAALSAHFRRIAELLAGPRVPGLVAIFPTFGQPFARYRHHAFHQIAAATARAAGLEVVDLLDCFRAYDFRDVRVDVVHPSPLGHRVAARATADALCRSSWPCPTQERRCTDYRPQDFPRVHGY